MKTGLYTLCYSVISCMAIALCFVPLVLLGWRKMRQVNTYCILGLYWFLNGLVNLLSLHLFRFDANRTLFRQANLYFNLIETPLVLLAFACARSGRSRAQLLLVLLLFITGESLLLLLKGYHFSTILVILITGLLLIITYCLTGLLQYVKKIEHTRFEHSMVFVYGSLLFVYGSFLIIYIFAHMRGNTHSGDNDTDSFLLYYISLLMSAAITSIGLWGYGIRKSRRSDFSLSGYSSSSS